jgi:hypothetical protein
MTMTAEQSPDAGGPTERRVILSVRISESLRDRLRAASHTLWREYDGGMGQITAEALDEWLSRHSF